MKKTQKFKMNQKIKSMIRTKHSFELPDAINCSIHNNFTQVPNQLIRNPEITAKAKTILSILLSNKEGWHTYIHNLKQMMKEGISGIETGLTELTKYNYLLRVRYRNKITKRWIGSFWAYTDEPGNFNIIDHIKLLDEKGLEIDPSLGISGFDPQPVFPEGGKPRYGNHTPGKTGCGSNPLI